MLVRIPFINTFLNALLVVTACCCELLAGSLTLLVVIPACFWRESSRTAVFLDSRPRLGNSGMTRGNDEVVIRGHTTSLKSDLSYGQLRFLVHL